MDLDKLHDPFPPEVIHFRVGATNKNYAKSDDDLTGIALAYVDARDVRERLDVVCVQENWQTRTPFKGCCELSIRVNGEWITKTDGAGETDVEGVKGQYSDAFKRAAVCWGVGQYLYGMPNKWYSLKKRGNSYAFTDNSFSQIKQDYKGWLPKHRFAPGEKAQIVQTVREHLEAGDGEALKEFFSVYENEEKMKVWGLFNSTERSCINAIMTDTK